MALIDKISTIALGSVTVAGASAYYSYSTSIKEDRSLEINDKKVDSPKRKRVMVDWTKAKEKPAYKSCITGPNAKPASVCGWLYNGAGVN